MTSEEYFIELKIYVVIGMHHHPHNWWAQASKTIGSISIKVEARADTLSELLDSLALEWRTATEGQKKEFFTPPLLTEYTPYKELSSEEIPF